jgi:histidinol-phosphate/aromatic aminotransferase/cobyric acid decarboxylase-like protein
MSVSSDAPDAASGRVRGTIRPQGAAFDVRVYSTPELCALLRETGFRVERIDGELTPDRSVAGEEGRAELVGRALPVLPRVLAVSSWWTPASVALDLRYAPDEAELLDPQPQRIWHSLVDSLPESGAHVVGGYAVDDPYGGERGAVVVAGYFGCPLASRQVTFGAGVTSLLHALAGLADGGVVLASELVHGDLEAWVLARGAETHLVPDRLEVSELARAIEVARPALVHLDRPTFTGRVLPLAQLAAVARVASRVGAPVLVDESAAPYLGGNGSAATLVPDADNLVVLRGFTKAYSLGGLRAAFVVASDGVAGRIRELVPPLQVGELALQAALRLLAAGDVFAPLRARVEEVKPAVVDELRAAGFDVEAGTAMLPWVAVADRGGEATRSLDRYGIRALAPAPPPGAAGAGIEILRLTIPLAEHRVELLRRLLRSDPGPGGDAARAMPDGRLSAWPQDL